MRERGTFSFFDRKSLPLVWCTIKLITRQRSSTEHSRLAQPHMRTARNSFTNFFSLHVVHPSIYTRNAARHGKYNTHTGITSGLLGGISEERCTARGPKERRGETAEREAAGGRGRGGGGRSSTSSMWRNQHKRAPTHIHVHIWRTRGYTRDRADRFGNLFLPEVTLPVRGALDETLRI